MKKLFALLALFSLGAFVAIAVTPEKEGARTELLFNFDWKFHLGEATGAETVSYDDQSWQLLDIPHDFQFDMPWSETGSRNRGFKEMNVGWYRKHFQADPAWQGKRLSLDFEGIMLTGEYGSMAN